MIRLALAVLLVSVAASAAELEDVPARAAVVGERAAVQQLYDRSLDKDAAARLLLGKAAAAKTPLRHYAILAEAKRLALAAKDVDLALRTIDATGRFFKIDVVVEKLAILKVQRVRTASEQRTLIKYVMGLVVVADRANDHATVVAALKVATTMARRVRDTNLVKTLVTRKARAAVLVREWAKVRGAVNILSEDPENLDASLQVGLFYCLFRGEWSQGLQFMAAGTVNLSDQELVLTTSTTARLPANRDARNLEMAKIARADLQQPTDAVTCAQLGDSWVATSKLYTGKPKASLLRRAGRWYTKAITASKGASRRRLERRVSRTSGIRWYGIPGGGLKEHHFFERWCRSTAIEVWTRWPKSQGEKPPRDARPVAYGFTAVPVAQQADSKQLWHYDPNDRINKVHWSQSVWWFDEAAQELRITYPPYLGYSPATCGNITKTFSVGLRGGKLFLYNCRQDGTETNETALEYVGDPAKGCSKTPPIDLTQ